MRLTWRKKSRKLPVVADIEPPFYGDFLKDQSKKLELVGQIKQQIATLAFNPPDLRPVEVYDLSRTLYGLYGYLGNALDEVGTNEPALTRQLIALRQAIEDLRKAMLAGDNSALEEHSQKLAQFQQALFSDLIGTFQFLQHQDDSAPLRVEDLPPAVHNEFVGVTGKLLLQVYPKDDVWERDNQEKFVAALRTVDPNATGLPVQFYEYETMMKDSYLQAAWYSLAAIALMVFFHFRSVGAVILSLLPVGIGTLWLAGLMGRFGIPINLANIMTLPLVIGIGVTNGIHILNRFAEERTPGILARSTGKAVLVSGLTAIAGFGSLMLAKHHGMYSLGLPDGDGHCDLHDRGADIFAGVVEFAGPVASVNKTTQCRQLAVDTGSGGTEVKPQLSKKHKENSQEVNINVKPNFQRPENKQTLFSITITHAAKNLVKTPPIFALQA